MMKATSVSIASVILLVATIAIAGLYSDWLKNINKNVFKSAGNNERFANCSHVKITIKEVNYTLVNITHEITNISYFHNESYQSDSFNITIDDTDIGIILELTPIPY